MASNPARRLSSALLGALGTLACGGGAPATPDAAAVAARILRDPAVVAIDAMAPASGLDGVGSLFLGSGWGRPESAGTDADWSSMVWALGREAEVHFLVPPVDAADLFVRCLPYPWGASSPIQTVEVLHGNRSLGRAELDGRWQDLRFPLPDDLRPGSDVRLQLRFAHALSPRERGEADPRQLAAAFTSLGVVPRGVRNPNEFLAAHRFDAGSGSVALPVRAGLRPPLPPASRGSLRLGDVRLTCRGCRLLVEIHDRSGRKRELVAVKEPGAGEIEIPFATGAGAQSLWLRVEGTSVSDGGGGARFVLVGIEAATKVRWWTRAERRPPDIFLYIVDTLRADAVGPDRRSTLAPAVAAFAGDALDYVNARAASSWTLPSVVSLFTGLYPDRHGVMTGAIRFDPSLAPPLQQRLSAAGYHSIGVSHSFIVSAAYGLDAGFDDFYLTDHLNGTQLRSHELRGTLASWLSQRGGPAALFAYLHAVGPHAPYTPPEDLRAAEDLGPLREGDGLPSVLAAQGSAVRSTDIDRLRRLYEAEVRYADREFGRFVDLLKWLGLYDGSYVILSADHGEEFGEHGGFEHGTTLYDEVLRVPLLVKFPGERGRGRVVSIPAGLVDLAPTLLQNLVTLPEGTFDGSPLSASGRTGAGLARVDYAEVAGTRESANIDVRSLVLGDVKCVEDRGAGSPARLEAYDLSKDPTELRALVAESPEAVRCRQLFSSWAAERARQTGPQRSRRPAPPEALERLRALGYL